MKNLLLGFCIFLFVSINSFAQENANPKNWEILNTDFFDKIKTTQNHIYNFEFDKANIQIVNLKNYKPHHPISFFLQGLAEFWKLQTNKSDKKYDSTMHSYMDSTILVCKNILNENKTNTEAIFFLEASYGFKSYVYNLRQEYTYSLKCQKIIKKQEKQISKNPEYKILNFKLATKINNIEQDTNAFNLWGQAINQYNKLFNRENKDIDLMELLLNSNFILQKEAAFFYLDKCKNRDSNFELLETIYNQHPNNPVLIQLFSQICYRLAKSQLVLNTSELYLELFNKKLLGFNEIGCRKSNFYIAKYLEYNGSSKAINYYSNCIDLSEKYKLLNGYYIYSLDALKEYYMRLKNYENAKKYCLKIINNPKIDKKCEQEIEILVKAKTTLEFLNKMSKNN